MNGGVVTQPGHVGADSLRLLSPMLSCGFGLSDSAICSPFVVTAAPELTACCFVFIDACLASYCWACVDIFTVGY